MDATVDDFLNEINEIVPPKSSKQSGNTVVWQECFDELTGYTYYWNTKTDEVTWTTPANYVSRKEQNKEKTSQKAPSNLYVPPRSAPLFPSTSKEQIKDSIKIYKISENKQKYDASSAHRQNKIENKKSNSYAKKFKKPASDSEDEKIVLISSYGDSDSDSENNSSPQKQNNNTQLSDEDDDDIDILTKIQTRAKELQKLEGTLPKPVENNVEKTSSNKDKVLPLKNDSSSGSNKDVSKFSLVAGYSDSEEEIETEETKTIFPIQPVPEEPKITHSTLFPVTKPIDVKDFIPAESVEIQPETVKSENEFDSKVFQRKRRIGINLVNVPKKIRPPDDTDEPELNERKGFGFSKDAAYTAFTKGEVMFTKAETLNPPNVEQTIKEPVPKTEEDTSIRRKDVDEIYMTLKEKLSFLSEGKSEVSSVQVMMIQAETLSMAMKDGGLKMSYLHKWLKETCDELIKLEKEATPDGWLLEWDRSHKRYYYQNQTTGESQWEYPQPDIVRCDEAMDICTTPPPPVTAAVDEEPSIPISPPLPPTIRSPTPPPPPVISSGNSTTKSILPANVPLPKNPPLPRNKFVDNGEPLPPGVDLPEIVTINEPKESDDKLHNALDSFYSDIAAIESTNSPPVAPSEEPKMDVPLVDSTESTKKKKKPKVKLTQGLAMKKKGVSKLVEKWKNVQMNYD